MLNCNVIELSNHIDTAVALKLISEQTQPLCLSGAWTQSNINTRYDVLSCSPIVQIQQQSNRLIVTKNQHANAIDISALDWLEEYLHTSQQSYYIKPQCQDGTILPAIYGFIGYISYDYARRLENTPIKTVNDTNLPDFSGGIYYWNFINDNVNKQSYITFHPLCPNTLRVQITKLFNTITTPNYTLPLIKPNNQTIDFKLTSHFINETPKKNYLRALSIIGNYIKDGDCYQVNFSHRHKAMYKGTPSEAFSLLNASINTPYTAYLKFNGYEILSFSPERFIKINGDTVETKPIKGTINRGSSKTHDSYLQKQLKNSKKDQSENLMIVDLMRNDLNRTCHAGSVKVPSLFAVETYPNVHHLVSTITGKKPSSTSALEVLKQAFPGGSITGAPKIRAMEIIEELESYRRSIYCGSIFYVDFNGNMDSNICIRTLLCKDDAIYCWGGGGIVADSNCEDEYQESITKIKNLMDALEEMSGLK